MKDLLMSVKQRLRPLIPDAVMARYRVRQHSLAMRSNVDVFVQDGREVRRWLQLTPDTYRVVSGSPITGGPETVVFVGEKDDVLGRVVGVGDVEVAVAGTTLRPSMQDLRVTEPAVIPMTIAASLEAFDEIGGIVDNSVDLVRTYQRFADAGFRIGLVPSVADELPEAVRLAVDVPAVVVFAGVPLHDIGGGSRGAQISFELLEMGFHVTYVAMHPSAEGLDLGLRYVHPLLEQYTVETFDADDIGGRASAGTVILEAPAEPFVEPARLLKEHGWTIVYDIIDDWTDASLGGFWYKPEVEREISEIADIVVASAPDLVDHGMDMGGETSLIPNAVNSRLFGPVAIDVPADLPKGEIIGYAGSLYGEWFDWGALRSVAEAFESSTVVVIGDDRYKRPMPPNVVFLGLKPQTDLPAYMQRFNVGIVPFELSEVTHAVSPLKVYEYLASGVPVAAPPLRALQGLDDVHTDVDLAAAVAKAMSAPRPDRDVALALHSWNERVTHLMRLAGAEEPQAAGVPVSVVRRVPVHYAKRDRRVHLG